jgi:hypothetical protein
MSSPPGGPGRSDDQGTSRAASGGGEHAPPARFSQAEPVWAGSPPRPPELGLARWSSAWTPVLAVGLACLIGAAFFIANAGNGTPAASPTASNGLIAAGASTESPTVLPPTPGPTPTACGFPLAGQQYRSNRIGATDPISDDPYRAVWTSDGCLWQPYLSPSGQRQSFSVAIEIPNGRYSFDGVESLHQTQGGSTLYLDEERNGQGASNPAVAGHENGRMFSVHTNDGAPAWGLVEGSGGASAGFQLELAQPLCPLTASPS